MFKSNEAFSSFSVDDLPKAIAFYSQVLGLQVSVLDGLLELEIANGSKVLVYPKSSHIPATFTVLNIPVDNVEQALDELVKHGVHFEHYRGGQDEVETDAKGIFNVEEMDVRQAWFKDPAGNIFSIIESH